MLNNEFLNWYRAEQNSKKYSIYTFSDPVTNNYLVYLLIQNLNSYMSYIYGLAIAECTYFILYSLRFKLSVQYNFNLYFQF